MSQQTQCEHEGDVMVMTRGGRVQCMMCAHTWTPVTGTGVRGCQHSPVPAWHMPDRPEPMGAVRCGNGCGREWGRFGE